MTDSPEQGERVFLAVGRLRRAHGVHGEMQMDVLTDFPERLKPGVKLYVGPEYQPVHIRKTRWMNQVLLIAFQEIQNPEQAAELRNQIIYVSAKELPPLEEGEYYYHQLLGMRVIDEMGKTLGTLAEILETGANDVYVIRNESRPDLLLPAINETILSIDLEKGEMIVHLLPGL